MLQIQDVFCLQVMACLYGKTDFECLRRKSFMQRIQADKFGYTIKFIESDIFIVSFIYFSPSAAVLASEQTFLCVHFQSQ